MTPSTTALLRYLRDDGQVDEPDLPSDGYGGPETRQMMELRMKKKRHQMMLKQMMTEAGYGDIVKMTNIGKQSYEVGSEENS